MAKITKVAVLSAALAIAGGVAATNAAPVVPPAANTARAAVQTIQFYPRPFFRPYNPFIYVPMPTCDIYGNCW